MTSLLFIMAPYYKVLPICAQNQTIISASQCINITVHPLETRLLCQQIGNTAARACSHIIWMYQIECIVKNLVQWNIVYVRLILYQVFVLGPARGLGPHWMQGPGGETLRCDVSSLDNTAHLCHHTPIPLPERDFLWYMGFRPYTATQGITILQGSSSCSLFCQTHNSQQPPSLAVKLGS